MLSRVSFSVFSELLAPKSDLPLCMKKSWGGW